MTPNKRRLAILLASLTVSCAALILLGAVGFAWMFCRKTPSPHMVNLCLISELTKAVDGYRLDCGSYPWPKPDEVTPTTEIRGSDVYRALRGKAGGHDYLKEIPGKHIKGCVLVDTWGHPILFRVNPKGLAAVIWSCGENGRDETNTGASPDPAKLPRTYYYFGSGKTGDDIGNL